MVMGAAAEAGPFWRASNSGIFAGKTVMGFQRTVAFSSMGMAVSSFYIFFCMWWTIRCPSKSAGVGAVSRGFQ